MPGFLNAELVRTEGHTKQSCDASIKCVCYDRFTHWVCPDPRDKKRCAAAESQLYIARETYYITEEEYTKWLR